MNKLWRSIKSNAPIILAVTSGITSTAAVVAAIFGTMRAIDKCPEINQETEPEKSRGEIFREVAPCYIPTVVLWVTSLACMIGSTALNSKQKASLLGAYMLVNGAYSDYINKNKELFGDLNHEQVVEEMAKERYQKTAHPREEDTKLYYEGYYGEYFESTPQKVLEAEYELNRRLIMNEVVTLGDFFELLDLPRTEASELGWSTWTMFDYQDNPWIDIRHDPVIMDDGLECEILEFVVSPVPDYDAD